MVKARQQQQLDLADRLERIQILIEEIQLEIERLQANFPVAPDSSWIVRYRAKGRGGAYWYYKWQSTEPIFTTLKGNSSCHKYIGKAGSPAFLKAVEMMKTRTQIEALQQVQHTLELGRADLVEEATRTNKESPSNSD